MGSHILFGEFQVDVANACLSRNDNEIHLTPKAFAVLHVLLIRHGQVVAREQLLTAVWPNVVVGDSAIASAIRELRKALDDDARSPRYIETLHRRGYRFVGQVTHQTEPTPTLAAAGLAPPRRRRHRLSWYLAAAAILTATSFFYVNNSSRQSNISQSDAAYRLPDKPSLAILPFVNLSGDAEQNFLVDGIGASITTALVKIPNLFVIARRSSLTYKGKSVALKQVAQDLGVRYLLEGSVQRAGDRIRVNVHLVDTLTGHHLWAEVYDRKFDDVLDLQKQITWKVATELEVELTQGEMARVWRQQTSDPQAYRHLLLGIERFDAHTKLDLEQALQHFEKAVALDRNFAGAWVWLGWTHRSIGKQGYAEDVGAAYAKAVKAAKKALLLDGTNADAYSLLGNMHWQQREFEKGFELNRKAVQLDPNYADNVALLASRLNYSNRPEEALVVSSKALRLNPFYPGWYLSVVGITHFLLGEYDKAITALEESVEYYPESRLIRSELAMVYAAAGRSADAREVVNKILNLHPNYTIADYQKIEPMPDEMWQRFRRAMLKAGLPEKPPTVGDGEIAISR